MTAASTTFEPVRWYQPRRYGSRVHGVLAGASLDRQLHELCYDPVLPRPTPVKKVWSQRAIDETVEMLWP